MIVQAVVDHDYLFSDICVGWPGSVHDARIFVNSSIYKRITEDKLIECTGFCTILGQQIPPYQQVFQSVKKKVHLFHVN